MKKIHKEITIKFWKLVACLWDLRPRKFPKKFHDYPIASTEIAESYEYPQGVKVLYEWDEMGQHWIVFSR